MRKIKAFIIIVFLFNFVTLAIAKEPIAAPKLTNNPTWDVIVTSTQPLLSFFNSTGGEGKRRYIIQIDRTKDFSSKELIEYGNVVETNQYITEKRDITHKLLEEKDALKDETRYYWRVRAVDQNGKKSPWAVSRFYLDTKADDSFMDMVRIQPEGVEVSSGENPKNIIDLDDPGQSTFWQSTPPGDNTQWVKFDLGKVKEVARIWMLSTPNSPDGWLKDFVWQKSKNGKRWRNIKDSEIKGNDTYRNIIDIKPVKTRYIRLLIKDWYGYAAQINAVTLYAPGQPKVPEVPKKRRYVLLVGNQENGFTFSELANFVETCGLGLKTVTVPHYEVSLDMLNKLERKPIAIILSGNNANYPNLPMFEYNGEYEIIRSSEIPILGICCGHQQLAMAYGYTYARSMGWDDISSMETAKTRAEIKQVKDDPIFRGMKSPFTAVEIHGWAVAVIPEEFELIAESTYVQAIKNKSKMIYGEQFHGEIKAPYNEGRKYLVNFLKMAIKNSRK